jgi:hypothetical protein
MSKPALFVGSSSEGLEFARAVRGRLDSAAAFICGMKAFSYPAAP